MAQRPIDDPEVREQHRRHITDALCAAGCLPLVLGALVIGIGLLVAIVAVVRGDLEASAFALVRCLLIALIALGAAVTLAALVSPCVLLYARARRRALEAPWRAARCTVWNVDGARALVTVGEQMMFCTIGDLQGQPEGTWAAEIAEGEGRFVILRPRGTTLLVLARRRSPRPWTTHRVRSIERSRDLVTVQVRANARDLTYLFRDDLEAAEGRAPDWIEVTEDLDRVAIRAPGWPRPQLATVRSRKRSRSPIGA